MGRGGLVIGYWWKLKARGYLNISPNCAIIPIIRYWGRLKASHYLNISPIFSTYLRTVQLSMSTPFRSFSKILGKLGKKKTQGVSLKIQLSLFRWCMQCWRHHQYFLLKGFCHLFLYKRLSAGATICSIAAKSKWIFFENKTCICISFTPICCKIKMDFFWKMKLAWSLFIT